MNSQVTTMKTFLQKSKKRKGSVTVLALIFVLLALAFLAFTIDLGLIAVTESELQNAADSSAMSAARALPDREAALIAASTWAARNAAAGENVSLLQSEDVIFGRWDEDTSTFTAIAADSDQTPDAVKVICRLNSSRNNALGLFLAPMFGVSNVDMSASAIAQSKGSSCGGIMALEKIYLNDRQVGRASYTDSYNSNLGDYTAQSPAQNGDICTNGHLTLNGNSFVNGDARWWEGANSPNASASQVSGEFASFPEPIIFPEINPGTAASDNNNNMLTNSNLGQPVLTNGRFALGTSVASDSITLPPGVYYFADMTVANNSMVTVTGPTYIYVEGQIDLRFGGINNTTRKPINLQIYPMGQDTFFYLPFFGELHASIYSTKAHIYLDEKSAPVNLHFFGKMVGQKIRVWDTALHVDESISFGQLESGGEQVGKSGVVLVE